MTYECLRKTCKCTRELSLIFEMRDLPLKSFIMRNLRVSLEKNKITPTANLVRRRKLTRDHAKMHAHRAYRVTLETRNSKLFAYPRSFAPPSRFVLLQIAVGLTGAIDGTRPPWVRLSSDFWELGEDGSMRSIPDLTGARCHVRNRSDR